MKKHLKRYVAFHVLLVLLFVFCGQAISGDDEQVSWKRRETKYTIVQYRHIDDLKKFDRSIDFAPDEFSIRGLFSSGDPKDPFGSITRKMDSLFERVQQILDMRKKMKKVIINIYPDAQQFHEAYYHITWTQCQVRSWYLYETNTIYINVDDIHEGILAHEMAHAIINNYLDVRPPRATAEILAVYVDQHLFD